MPASSVDRNSETETDVALALCNLGVDCQQPAINTNLNTVSPSPQSSLIQLADAACSYSPNSSSPSLSFPRAARPPLLAQQFLRQVTSEESPPTTPKSTPSHSVPIRQASHLDISARRAKKNDVKHQKRRNKGEDTSVSFAEMTRLMNTYGPLKCLRNRSSKNPEKEIKAASILRKFYRWFPDFEGELLTSLRSALHCIELTLLMNELICLLSNLFLERFVKTADGRYMPKIGHEKEIKYREMMRGRDEKYVITKRNMRRYSLDVMGDPMDGNFGMPKSH
jgi:hypothetical protein